jgi:hypothetical protein
MVMVGDNDDISSQVQDQPVLYSETLSQKTTKKKERKNLAHFLELTYQAFDIRVSTHELHHSHLLICLGKKDRQGPVWLPPTGRHSKTWASRIPA